jgi:glycerate kinase
MKVVIAIDSLKGSLTSIEAANAIKKGILSACDAEVVIKPLADGGEGTVEALIAGMNGITKKITVTGPLFDKVNCIYGQLPESKTAIIEMSAAAGITLVPEALKNPMNTTTYGVGEIIKDAIRDGCRNFIIGIGGSATNDCGLGMLQALGFEFYNKERQPVGADGKSVAEIEYISTEHALPELQECSFSVACDVNNPLYGPNGASYVYGPQKGATPEIVTFLDEGIKHFSERVRELLGKDNATIPGTGAAGGLGYAFVTFLNATLESGINIILKEIALENDIKDADIVITGEGRLDYQTAMGKAPIGVAKLAKKYGAIVLAFAGSTTSDAEKCNEEGIDAYFDIISSIMTLEEAIDSKNAALNMERAVRQVFRLIHCLK